MCLRVFLRTWSRDRRWGGPSGRAHPYRLCQSISEQWPAFSHSPWMLHTHTCLLFLKKEVHSDLRTTGGYISVFYARSRGPRVDSGWLLLFRETFLRRDRRILLRTVITLWKAGRCLDLSWSKSTSPDRSQTTVSWNVRMVSEQSCFIPWLNYEHILT